MSEDEKPKDFGEAFKKHIGDTGDKITADDAAALGEEVAEDETDLSDGTLVDDSKVPEWAVIPPDLKIPPGRKLYFLRFLPEMTDVREKGERHCVMWNLTSADERAAWKRTRGESSQLYEELSKQMVRAVDGKRVDWSKAAPELVRWWDEIGSKCRNMVKGTYQKTHNMDEKERTAFFMNCFAVRGAVGG